MGQVAAPATILLAYNAEQAIRGAVVNGGTRLNPGDFVLSPRGVTDKTIAQTRDASGPNGGRYRLEMQTDGNLVLYDVGTGDRRSALWSSGTSGRPGAYAVMQSDGNFVVYRNDGQPLWSTGTPGHPGAVLMVQSDDNLVIYAGVGAGVLWARRDHGSGGFWSGVFDVIKAIPAIAVAPIWIPTAAIVDATASVVQGKAPTLGTTGDLIDWSATHPVETIAITAGAAAVAAGTGAVIGAYGASAVIAGTGAVAAPAGKVVAAVAPEVLPDPGPPPAPLTPAGTPDTTGATPETSSAPLLIAAVLAALALL